METSSENLKKFRGNTKFEDFYRIAVNSIKLTGVNLMPDEEYSLGFKSTLFSLYNKFWFINGALLVFSMTFSIKTHLSNAADFTKILTSVFTGFFNYYKGYLMFKNEKRIKKIMKALKSSFLIFAVDQEKFGVKRILKRLLLMKRIYVSLYGILLIFAFAPIATRYVQNGERSTSGEVWIPLFLLTNDVNFFAVTIWTYWIATAFCLCGFGADFILFSTITLLSLEFKVLKEDLKCKINDKGDLKDIIIRHDRLIQLCSDLHDIFEDYLFFYISQSSVLVSMMCFQLAVTEDFALFIPFLLITLNQVWLLCYFGQKLHDSSSSIFDGISESNWYEVKDIKIRKILVFITQRSQKSKVLSARYVIITLSTFRGILITAYSYYTLLNLLYKESN